jgi:hypothetical protein
MRPVRFLPALQASAPAFPFVWASSRVARMLRHSDLAADFCTQIAAPKAGRSDFHTHSRLITAADLQGRRRR